MDCIFPPLPPLCVYLCIPPLPPRGFHRQNIRILSSRRSTQPSSHLPNSNVCVPFYLRPPLIILEDKEKFSEKNALRVVVTERMSMVKKICISLPLLVLQSCLHYFSIPPCSCVPCRISVGEKKHLWM